MNRYSKLRSDISNSPKNLSRGYNSPWVSALQHAEALAAAGSEIGLAAKKGPSGWVAFGQVVQQVDLGYENSGSVASFAGDVIDLSGFPEIGGYLNLYGEATVAVGAFGDCLSALMGAGLDACTEDGAGLLTDDLGGRELEAAGFTKAEAK